jgi:lipid II:glycine glycyltransferase (peptidoglycan interpeptide bridge formation enzyme)
MENKNVKIIQPVNYMFQDERWVKAWSICQGIGHKTIIFKTENLKCSVYQYPWHGGYMWYTGIGPSFDPNILSNFEKKLKISEEYFELLSEISKEAKKQKIVFLKLDLNDNFASFIDINDNNLQEFLKQRKYKTNIIASQLQFKEIAYLDLDILNKIENRKNSYELVEFVDFYQPLLAKFSKTRRQELGYVFKKYLNKKLTLNIEKTKENFEGFWKVHQVTSIRHNITTNSKEYCYKLLHEDFSRIIVGYDEMGEPCCGWYGLKLDESMIYLLGGNNEISMANQWQHMLHIKALNMAYNEGCKIYDFCGYSKGTGYGNYKDRFNPEIRSFVGPIDIIFKPLKYNLIFYIKKVKNILFNS